MHLATESRFGTGIGLGHGELLRLLGGLSGLEADVLTFVPNALTLVRVGRTESTDLGGGLPHLLLVDSRHGDAGVLVYRNRDPLREGELDGMAVSEVEDGLILPCVEALYPTPLISLRSNPLVTPVTMLFSRARMRPWLARSFLLSLARDTRHVAVSTSKVMPSAIRWGALGTLDVQRSAVDLDVDTRGHDNGFTPIRDMVLSVRFCRLPGVAEDFAADTLPRASRSVSTPPGVVRMATPSPFRTRGMSALPKLTAAGLADALKPADDTVEVSVVPREHANHALLVVVEDGVIIDEALILEDADDLDLDLGPRHQQAAMARMNRCESASADRRSDQSLDSPIGERQNSGRATRRPWSYRECCT